MMQISGDREQERYEIHVQGWIDKRWSGWFDGMTLTHEGTEDDSPITKLSGPVADQAAQRGLITKIWDMNLTLVLLARVETARSR